MEVGSSRETGRADVGDDLSARDALAFGHLTRGAVTVEGGDAATVVNHDDVTVAVHDAGEGDDALGGGGDRGSPRRAEIDACMQARRV